jgi:putative ABC transport system substrate-binding protein
MITSRRKLIALFASTAAVSWPLSVGAEQSTKVARLGFLRFGSASANAGRVEALRVGLRELGYVQDTNIIIEFGWADTIDELDERAAELVRINVDVIFAMSSTETNAARRATKTIPIVFAAHADPVGLGHVASLSRPSGNIFEGAFATLVRERVGGFFVSASSFSHFHRTLLAELALKHGLPGMFGARDNVEAGGLMSYSPDQNDLTRRAATYVDKILKGTKPADLPVEQASKYQLVINLKTAKALGLTVPATLLARADEVIE